MAKTKIEKQMQQFENGERCTLVCMMVVPSTLYVRIRSGTAERETSKEDANATQWLTCYAKKPQPPARFPIVFKGKARSQYNKYQVPDVQ